VSQTPGWVAIYAAVVATAALGWQAVSHFLSGPRVKTEVRLVVKQSTGLGSIPLGHLELLRVHQVELRDKNFIGVWVANVGRQPVTIDRWSVQVDRWPFPWEGDRTLGPPTPHRLEVGESAIWAVDLFDVVPAVYQRREALRGVAGAIRRRRKNVIGRVTLGSGRTVRARARAAVGALPEHVPDQAGDATPQFPLWCNSRAVGPLGYGEDASQLKETDS
jgi:hypothetical protein